MVVGLHSNFTAHAVDSPEKVSVLLVHNTPLFFSNRDGKWMPTLRLLHQYPDMMPKLRADQGAIKFVLAGSIVLHDAWMKELSLTHMQAPTSCARA